MIQSQTQGFLFFSNMLTVEKKTPWLGKNYYEILKNIRIYEALVMKNE